MPAAARNLVFSTPEEAETAFYEALELGDIELLMCVWADDDDIVCIHPGGNRLIGAHAVRASWKEILANGPLPLQPLRIHTVQSVMSCVHTLVERLAVDSSEGSHVVLCYATNVFHKGPAGWRLLLHHSSQAPDDAGVAMTHDVPDTLH